MADRGRDVVLRVVSDETKFDLSGVSQELSDTEDAAQRADRELEKTTDELKRLAVQGQAAQKQLDALNAEAAENRFDELGKDAKATARKVDQAFDSMAKSAKTSTDTIHHESGEAFGEISDEAKANLSEVSSSFQGDMTSAIDLVQGTLGGLVGSIPGIGTAIAAVSAVGVGLLAGMWQKSQEAAEAARQAATDYFDTLVSGQGRVDQSAAIQKVLDDEDGSLKRNLETAKRYGVARSDVVNALAGDAEARARVVDVIQSQLDAEQKVLGRTPKLAASSQDRVNKLNDLKGAIDRTTTAQVDGTSKFDLFNESMRAAGLTLDTTTTAFDSATGAIEQHTVAVEEAHHELDAFTEPAQLFSQLLDEQASKAEESGRKFKVSAKSVKEFIAELGKQVTAQENFTANLTALARKGVSEGFIAELEAQGPAAASAVQALTKATPAQVKAINSLYARQGKDAGGSWRAGLEGQGPAVQTTAAGVHAKAAAELGKPMPIKVAPPPPSGPNSSANAAEQAWREAQDYLDKHPVKVSLGVAGSANAVEQALRNRT